jgi:dihydroflavonol-4-reductase
MSDLAAVSGASGFIGSAVVRKLLSDGRRVRALVEPGADTRNLEGLSGDIERVSVDVCDYAGMKRALQDAGAYYHLAAIYKVWTPDPTTIYRVNIEGTTAALLAARDAGVGRVVYTSSIAAVGRRDDGAPSDETIPWNLQDVANEYILTKHLSERIALRFAEAGLPLVVVNPAFPFGPRDIAPTPTGGMILAVLRQQMPAVGEGGFCAVDVDDVAFGHVAAETKGRVGERYILGNHNVTFREFVSLVCSVAGVKEPKLSVPGWLGQGFALGMELISEHVTHKEPMGTYKSVRYLQDKPFFDVSKARRELGLPQTPLATSIERAVAYFREQGKA